MIPSARMIWIIAMVGFPAATLAALWPEGRLAAGVCLGGLAVVIAGDALRRESALQGIRVELPELVRMFKDRPAEIRVRVHNVSAGRIRVGVLVPDGIQAESEETDVELPSQTSEFVWKWTAHRRGLYRVEAVYLEAISPWGMWQGGGKGGVSMEVRVYPNLRRNDDLKALRQGVSGVHATRQVGGGGGVGG